MSMILGSSGKRWDDAWEISGSNRYKKIILQYIK